MRRGPLCTVLLLIVVPVAGCLGADGPAPVPQEETPPERPATDGWALDVPPGRSAIGTWWSGPEGDGPHYFQASTNDTDVHGWGLFFFARGDDGLRFVGGAYEQRTEAVVQLGAQEQQDQVPVKDARLMRLGRIEPAGPGMVLWTRSVEIPSRDLFVVAMGDGPVRVSWQPVPWDRCDGADMHPPPEPAVLAGTPLEATAEHENHFYYPGGDRWWRSGGIGWEETLPVEPAVSAHAFTVTTPAAPGLTYMVVQQFDGTAFVQARGDPHGRSFQHAGTFHEDPGFRETPCALLESDLWTFDALFQGAGEGRLEVSVPRAHGVYASVRLHTFAFPDITAAAGAPWAAYQDVAGGMEPTGAVPAAADPLVAP